MEWNLWQWKLVLGSFGLPCPMVPFSVALFNYIGVFLQFWQFWTVFNIEGLLYRICFSGLYFINFEFLYWWKKKCNNKLIFKVLEFFSPSPFLLSNLFHILCSSLIHLSPVSLLFLSPSPLFHLPLASLSLTSSPFSSPRWNWIH